MLNRDSKIACSGHKTKDSIISHSKEYPHLINFISHFDSITEVKARKGFHHIPNYKEDVRDLKLANVLTHTPSRSFKCLKLVAERNPFQDAYPGLSTLIHRHQPRKPFIRQRDPHF